jgi:TfoX/Sxy family transcriptional regulator of competence genes
MAFDEDLAERVRRSFAERVVHFDEKRMMGGLCFMVDGKMCVGISGERLMVRLDPDEYDKLLGRKGCVPMDFTGRPMRGFVFVTPTGTASRRDLERWIELALDFNPRAKASPKKPRTKGASSARAARNKKPRA